MSRPFVFAALVTTACAAVTAQEATLRVSSDLVHFGVIVTDKRGNVVPGLAAGDFEVLEEGKPQTIGAFAVGSAADAPDLHVGVMFDQSESMVEDIGQARKAGIRFLNLLPMAADLTLVEFADDVKVSRFQQDDFPFLVERIRSSKVDGDTALWDAFGAYLAHAGDDRGKSVLVAFTDGGNSRSQLTFSKLIDIARASQATVYIVGLLDHQSNAQRPEIEVRLRRIAEVTGGIAIFPTSMKQIDAAYDRIVDEIKGEYSLGYVSSNTHRDGKWRSVRIRVKRPDLKDVRVRTRDGYYAPIAP
jgi:Ca-activated chloride channel family protein